MDPRYTSPSIEPIWTPQARNYLERDIWIEVMQAQRELGMPIPEEAIDDYRRIARESTERDPDSEDGSLELLDIAELEKQTKHDLYARLRWFNEAAGHDYAHRGLTSADLVENVLQVQVLASLGGIAMEAEQVIYRLVDLIDGTKMVPLVARTHGRPAQLTTIGKRAADWLQELAHALGMMTEIGELYPFRGVRGAIGTYTDLAHSMVSHQLNQHVEGEVDGPWVSALSAAAEIEARVAKRAWDTPHLTHSIGQGYPRSQDLPLVAALLQIASACTSFATSIRLMALGDLVIEVGGEHVGSSAMPHKRNPRYSERICGLGVVARGYASMLQELGGMDWLEGDVSTSSTRRIAWPGLLHTVSTMLANMAFVLDHMRFDQHRIKDEVDTWMPEMASGALLAAMVDAGMSRTDAHSLLNHHYGQIGGPDPESQRVLTLVYHLEQDEACPLTREQITLALDPARLVGMAPVVADALARRAQDALEEERDPEWPGDLV